MLILKILILFTNKC